MCALFVQVTLCANTVKDYRLALVVDVDGVGEEVRTLPINARSGVRLRSCFLHRAGLACSLLSAPRCVVPDVVLDTPLLDFKRCFLNHPYEEKVRLTNAGAVPVCYGVLDQVRNRPTTHQVLQSPSEQAAQIAKLS